MLFKTAVAAARVYGRKRLGVAWRIMAEKKSRGGPRRLKMLLEQRKQLTRPDFRAKLTLLCIRVTLRRKSPKRQKCTLGKNFEHKPDSSYWQDNKVFWQTIWHLRGKYANNYYLLYYNRSTKHHNGVLLSNEQDILWRWREYLKHFLTVTLAPSDTQEAHFEEENSDIVFEIFLSCQNTEAAGCNEIEPKCSKPWIEKAFFGWILCFQWPGVLS